MVTDKNCRMCNASETLQKSHIIPRSYFKSLKDKRGQLFSVTCGGTSEAKLTNSDPKEYLLCRECEQYLSEIFERYGTRLLKDRRKVKRSGDCVIFENFRFKEFYLYLISILWRASISGLSKYKHINLGDEINHLLCHCLRENKIKIQTSLRLDHFFKISLIRIVDKTGQIDEDAIRKTMIDLNFERGEKLDDGILYYFMVDGFLILYHFSSEKDIHTVRTKKNFAQILNKDRLYVPISDLGDFKQLADGFSSLTKHAVKHNKR
ncbi:hypothetical protein [Oceanimonas doudoroffii]|uniref:hypothetical protein n=1 Tax=Oceanimonas doudoroffii TaxID=84158 RepID=UPI0011405BE0|nr:hypothetical protein [Oceanimonas doudoroffii]